MYSTENLKAKRSLVITITWNTVKKKMHVTTHKTTNNKFTVS